MAGLKPGDERFVPYGGGLGQAQLDWLEAELAAAAAAEQRVVIFSHVAVCPGACTDDCVLWNYEEVLRRIHAAGNTVVAVFAGHDHAGGYTRDAAGVHHVTLAAPLETPPPLPCHAVVEVHETALVLRGFGRLPSRLLPFPGSGD